MVPSGSWVDVRDGVFAGVAAPLEVVGSGGGVGAAAGVASESPQASAAANRTAVAQAVTTDKESRIRQTPRPEGPRIRRICRRTIAEDWTARGSIEPVHGGVDPLLQPALRRVHRGFKGPV